MTNSNTVSVALASYNGAKYLREQLDSIARQTYLPSELVICDDGSSDRTLAIVEEFSGTANFQVRLYRNDERLGHRRNFLKCANLCRGDLIAFCDQDDIWLKDKLAVQSAHFERSSSTLMSYHNATLVDQTGRTLLRKLYRDTNVRFLRLDNTNKYMMSYGFTQMFRRDLLLFSSFMPQTMNRFVPDEIMTHDHWFCLLALIFGQVHYDPACLALYRRHAENAAPDLPTTRQRIRRKLVNRRGQFDRMVDVWTNWRDVIRAIADTIRKDDLRIEGCDIARRTDEAIAIFEDIIQVTTRRKLLSNANSKRQKLALLMQSIRCGDYDPSKPWRNPPLALAREILMLLHPKSPSGLR